MVLSNGENVPPALVEQHLNQDPCFLQSMIVADNRPYVAALVVPEEQLMARLWQKENSQSWPEDWLENDAVHAWVLTRMHNDEHDLSSFMQVKAFAFVQEEWMQSSGLLTPTLKLKRSNISAQYADLIESLYVELV